LSEKIKTNHPVRMYKGDSGIHCRIRNRSPIYSLTYLLSRITYV